MRAYLTIHLPHESEALAFFSDVHLQITSQPKTDLSCR